MPTIIKVGGSVKKLNGTATADDVLLNKTFSNNGKELLTGSMVNNGSVSYTLPINGSYTIPKGYHSGTGKITQSITTLGATTYTPTTADQTIASGNYLSGNQIIKGDANLIAGNIASGKSIFGVVGTLVSNATKVAIGTFTTDTNYDEDTYFKEVNVGFQPSGVAIINTSTRNLGSYMQNNLLAMYLVPSSTQVEVWRLNAQRSEVYNEKVTEGYNQYDSSPYYNIKRTSTGFNAKFGEEYISGSSGYMYGYGTYWYIAWKV